MRLRSVLFRVAFWFITFLVVFSAGLTALLETGALTGPVVETADGRAAKWGLALSAGSLHWRPWSGLSLEDVRVTTRGDSTAAPKMLLSVGRLEGGYRLIDILGANFRLTRVGVVRPDLDLDAFLEYLSTVRAAAQADTTDTHRTFPAFRIDDLHLTHGRVRARGGDALSDLSLEGKLATATSVWNLDVAGARGRLKLGRFDEDVQVAGDFAFGGGFVGLDSVRVTSAGGSVHLNGKMDPRGERDSELYLHGESVPLQKIGQWFGAEHPLLHSDLAADIVITGRPDSLHLAGRLTGRADADDLERDIDFKGTRRGSRLDLESFRFRAGESLVDLTGILDLDEGPRIEALVQLRNVEPAVALADSDLAPVGDVSGVIRIEGSGLTRETFRGTAHMRLSHSRFFGFQVGEGNMRITGDRGHLSVEAAKMEIAGVVLSATGTIDAENRVDAVLRGNIANLADVGKAHPSVGTLSLPSGQSTVEVQLRGEFAAPAMIAKIVVDDAAWNGMNADRLVLDMSCARLDEKAQFDFRAAGEGVGTGTRRFDRLTADGYADAKAVVVRTLTMESQNAAARLAGRFDFGKPDQVSAKIDRLELRSRETTWSNATPVFVRKTPAGWTVAGLDLRGGEGTVSGQATVDASGNTSFRGVGKNLDLALLAPFFAEDRAPSGRVDFEGSGTFGKNMLAADMFVTMGKSRAGTQDIEGVEGHLSLHDDEALFDDVSIRLPFASIDVDGTMKFAPGDLQKVFGDSASRAQALDRARFVDLTAKVESSDFDWLWAKIPIVPARGGAGTIQLQVNGPFTAPIAETTVDLTKATLGTEPLDLFHAGGSFDGQVLTVRDGILKSGSGEIAVSGTLPLQWTASQPKPKLRPGQSAALLLQGRAFPLAAIAPIVSLFDLLTGTADAALTLRGEPGTLHFTGDFALSNGLLTIPTFDEPLRDGTATGSFDAQGIQITEARFVDGRDGVVTGQGRVMMKDLRATDYAIDVVARDYHYRSEVTGIRGDGSGTMQILARPAGEGRVRPFFQGEFQVARADLSEKALTPPSMQQAEDELPPGIIAPPAGPGEESASAAVTPRVPYAPLMGPERPPPPRALAELRLRGDRNLWVKTSEMDIEFAGNVVFHSTETYMGVAGEVHTLRGSYSVLNTRFEMVRAEVEFTDPKDVGDSYIDAEAEANVLDERVTALVTGTLKAPVIRLSTESGMSEPEIYELLALRIKRDDGELPEDQGVAARAFRDSYLAAFTTRFGGNLGREIGLDTFTYDAGEGTQGSRSSVTVGKNVGRDFFFRYREAVGGQDPTRDDAADPSATRETLETPERALTIEYRLNRMFMLQGETGTLPPGDDYLNLDLRAEWGY